MGVLFDNVSIFRGCDFSLINEFCSVRSYSRGGIIYYQGDALDNVYIMLGGSCKSYKYAGDKLANSFYPAKGEIINDFSLFAGHTLEILSNSLILSIKKSDLFRLVSSDVLLQESIKQTEFLNHSIDVNLMSSRERVAYTLINDLDFFNFHKRIEVAESLNMTQETLSRILKMLQVGKLISIKDGKIFIENKDGLSSLFLK